MISITSDTKQKLAWIGKRLFWGLMIALIASIAIEAIIYGLAEKVAQAYTGQFFK